MAVGLGPGFVGGRLITILFERRKPWHYVVHGLRTSSSSDSYYIAAIRLRSQDHYGALQYCADDHAEADISLC